jgi:hypothetical protein
LLKAPFLFLAAGAGVQVGMEFAAEFIEILFERCDVDVQLGWQAEEREIVHWGGWLHPSARGAEVRGAHGTARPARMRVVG